MSMKQTKNIVTEVVDDELKLANLNKPPFNSPHEGYSVILEELEEAQEQFEKASEHMDKLWVRIKDNNETNSRVELLENAAINGACEMIQVAAMCRKFKALKRSAGQ